jgi:hypothetical protein
MKTDTNITPVNPEQELAQRDHYRTLCEDMLPFLDRSGPEYLAVARKFDRRFQELESGCQRTTKEGM